MTANILDDIVANKRAEIEAAKVARPLESLRAAIDSLTSEKRPFKELFKRGDVLIAEIKPKSPSMGQLILHSPLEVADLYAKSEADAISVLTDEKYFGGSLELLREVRARVPQAILRKDFIVDEYQLYESLLAGADAYLLIAHVLREEELARLLSLGENLGLDALIEVHDVPDLEKALSAGAPIIGINNRDLESLRVDIAVTEQLMKLVPPGMAAVSESGIENAADARRVHGLGVRGILVGTSILQSGDPIGKIKELKQALYAR